MSKEQRIVDYIAESAENSSESNDTEMTVGVMEKKSTVPADLDADGKSTETEYVEKSREKSAGAKIALINGSNTAGVSAKWQERFLEDGYTDVIIGSCSETVSETVIFSTDRKLAEELKQYFPEALEETVMPTHGIDISLEQVEACVVISDKDTETEG